MPLLIILGILGAYGAAELHEQRPTGKEPLTPQQLDNMLCQMVGKSRKECRKILKQYTD